MVKPLTGVVVSNKMMKSVVVVVERLFRHKRMPKIMRARKRYMVRGGDVFPPASRTAREEMNEP
jgi:small subunit ribosomal protein S17